MNYRKWVSNSMAERNSRERLQRQSSINYREHRDAWKRSDAQKQTRFSPSPTFLGFLLVTLLWKKKLNGRRASNRVILQVDLMWKHFPSRGKVYICLIFFVYNSTTLISVLKNRWVRLFSINLHTLSITRFCAFCERAIRDDRLLHA